VCAGKPGKKRSGSVTCVKLPRVYGISPVGPRWAVPQLDNLPTGAAALFVFLATAAGARIVASDLRLAPHDLLHRLQIAGSRHARLFQFALFPALECFFKIVD